MYSIFNNVKKNNVYELNYIHNHFVASAVRLQRTHPHVRVIDCDLWLIIDLFVIRQIAYLLKSYHIASG